MNTAKISNAEAICLILVIFMNRLILNMPGIILKFTGSSSILNLILIIFLTIIFGIFIVKLIKPFSNSDIIDIAEYLGGKFLKWIVGIISIFYLLVLSSILIRNFGEFIHLVHFDKFPVYFILIFFILTGIIGNFFGSKSVIRTNLIIILIVAFGLLVTFASVIGDFSFERIFPIFGNGLNETFFSGISNLFAFGGLFFLFFINPMLKQENSFKKVSFWSIGIMGFFLLLAVASLLFAFPFILEVEEISPLYYITSIVGSGLFFQRPEAIFMLTWILAIMSYISVTILFLILMLKKLFKVPLSNGISIPIGILIFIIALIPKNIAQVRTIEGIVYKYASSIMIFVFFFIILLGAYIKHKIKQKSKNNDVLEELHE